MKIHYLFVPIITNDVKDQDKEDDIFKHLSIYEKIQLSLLEYDLTMMYGSTYVQKNYNF
jgi:hypothetical protein